MQIPLHGKAGRNIRRGSAAVWMVVAVPVVVVVVVVVVVLSEFDGCHAPVSGSSSCCRRCYVVICYVVTSITLSKQNGQGEWRYE